MLLTEFQLTVLIYQAESIKIKRTYMAGHQVESCSSCLLMSQQAKITARND